MLPVMQEIPYGDKADCMRACVASLLELCTKEVPNFMEEGPENYYKNLNKWAKKKDLIILDIEIRDKRILKLFKDSYMLASGYSPRQKRDDLPDKEKRQHGVIYLNNKLVHDPHPEQGGIEGKPIRYTIFISKDSAHITGGF